ncbi:PREDICTED: uncharacterized protein LOC104602035 isoform X2 [Nelumbo nucifera]|uniref:Uncharacterized protein LOC104602035 isoform X2 n=1 Tax=Nelumbo nucifera TaxID=4432 RepID=A0A1U8AN36_NELNU|nr:PREDICTED: uncharacterized protein LOC104602035 isoform X2 [Nelumbo nucifera]
MLCPCPKEPLVVLFFNVSTSFYLLFLFFYFSSILLPKFFHHFLCTKTISNSDYEYQVGYSEEEEEEEENHAYYSTECTGKEDLVANIIHGGEALSFLSIKNLEKNKTLIEERTGSDDSIFEGLREIFFEEQLPVCSSLASNYEHDSEAKADETFTSSDTDSFATPMKLNRDERCDNGEGTDNENAERNLPEDEKFLIFVPPRLKTRKLEAQVKDGDEMFGDSFTVGSTSKSSSEWKSSINFRDSEDPFSSSSRRSCPNWESYTVFQKYDEEMTFLNRISAQKLSETESLRTIEVFPRSISQRIVHKFTTKRPRGYSRNPYHELENAYVAQICLAWEALNWNYKNFQRFRASQEGDIGCPGRIAQQVQQFQVLLQRYIENEPYEYGRRPEVYARMRISAPKLLQVPEFRDSGDDQKEEFGSKISSTKFLRIMEDGIRTFMNFLKADKENHCEIIKSFFKRHRGVDPIHLKMVKKANEKKKRKLKDLCRAHKCIRKRKLSEEEEMEILMGLIDLKVVSRVLRMSEINEEQLQWCEEKMSKVRMWEGRIQRDSSPLFFPAH